MSANKVKVAFLGLGVMGGPMAGHLARAGHDVHVWNRTTSKAQVWVQKHVGVASPNAAEAIADCDVVALCLGDDPDVEAVIANIMPSLKADAIVIDHTTTSAKLARALHETLKESQVAFIDAPVSGGEAGAINGKLTVMCGGDKEAINRAIPVMQAYAASITHIGPSGAGQAAKMVNQICIAGVLQGLSEAVQFAEKEGLDIEKVLAAIGGGAAQSWQMNNRGQTMHAREFDFGFAVDWMRKDLRIALEAARENGASLPLAAMVDQSYARVQAKGGSRWDTSSLITSLE
jgi:3-hydroxyisobutyrate dehydrogenase-like beta-hydroxyacid dehydrogenase